MYIMAFSIQVCSTNKIDPHEPHEVRDDQLLPLMFSLILHLLPNTLLPNITYLANITCLN